MKIALLHDWLTGFRGGERVLEVLCQMYPQAELYTLIHQKGSTSPIIESRIIHTSFLDKIPGIHKNYRKFLPLMPLAASSLSIPADVDVVISSSHCVIKGVPIPKGAKHLSYVHSPMRYMYDQFDAYFGHASLPIHLAALICRPFLQMWDRDSNRSVDVMLGNSKFVCERIKHFYGHKAQHLYPFVDLDDFRLIQRNPPAKLNQYLMVTAFAPNKRVDVAIDAFNRLGERYPLRIIGSGSAEETARLRAQAGAHIEFLGNLSREQIVREMGQAKAFIFPGIEDFGITPLESLAAGTPVIAYAAGGVLETLTPATALFYSDSLADAVETFRPENFQKNELHARAEEFSKQRFITQVHDQVNTLLLKGRS